MPAKIHVIYNGIDLAEYHKTSDTGALTKYGVDPSRPLRFVCGPHHAAKGRHPFGGGDPLPAARYAGGAVRGRAGHSGDRRRNARRKLTMARACNPHVVWIEKMVTKPEAIQLYSNCARLLLPIGL